MSLVGNLLRKVSYKVSGGILGTASGEKPGGSNPVNNNSYKSPVSTAVKGLGEIGTKGIKVSPMVWVGIALMLVLGWLLFKRKK